MNGPAAPKDPEKKRPYFYILKDKEIFGAKQPDGSAIHFIYESDGRLINSAQIVGNITDEEELRLLESVEGFGRLVHSIGVSVETDNPKEEIEFVFQMYGRKNLYGGGTNLRCKLTGDGMEHRIYLSDYTWTEDDYIPGQIKFIMSTPEKLGKASVRLYLNDGYMAPEEVEEAEVDTKSENYCAMIAKSLMNLGNTYRIRKAIEKAKAGKSVTVAYIGGSITQGAGATPINTECYAYKSYQLFQNRFASGNNVKFIKAGVGGTPSELGMLRFDRDVLRDGEKPDIVIVEFAVNDEGDETKGDCYESLVRKILKLDWNPEVVLLFLSLIHISEVSIRDAVVEQFTRKEGRVLTKNQFFYDMFHPSNIGHTIMADCLQYLFERCELREHARLDAFENGLTEEGMLLQRLKLEPVIGGSFENVRLMDKKDVYEGAVIETGDFTATDQELQSVEMDDALNLTPEFPYNWMYDGTKTDAEAFTLRMNCKALVLIFKDSGEVDVGKAEVFVDGAHVLTADPHINNWQHCNAAILFNNENSEEHTVKIEIAKEDIDKKFTILGFGYVL